MTKPLILSTVKETENHREYDKVIYEKMFFI